MRFHREEDILMFRLLSKKSSRDEWAPMMVVNTISDAIEYMKAMDYVLDRIDNGDWLYIKGAEPLNEFKKVYKIANLIPEGTKIIKIERLLDNGREVDTANVLDMCLLAIQEMIPKGEIQTLLVLKLHRGEVKELTIDKGYLTGLRFWFSKIELQYITEEHPELLEFLG